MWRNNEKYIFIGNNGVNVHDNGFWRYPPQVCYNKDAETVVVSLIENAKESIYVEMFNFTNYEPLTLALEKALDNNIEIKIIADNTGANNPKKINKKNQLLGCPEQRLENRDGNKATIKWDTTTGLMHRKVVVIDKSIVFLGSTNWSSRAFNLNKEIDVLINDTGLAQSIIDDFNVYWGKCASDYPVKQKKETETKTEEDQEEPKPEEKPADKTPYKDRQCGDCQKYMKFMVSSKQWSVCGVRQDDMRVPPSIIGGKLYCPMSYIVRGAGWTLTYNPATKVIYLNSSDKETDVVMQVDNPNVLINGNEYQIDKDPKVMPKIINGMTVLPVKFLVDTFGMSFEWYAQTKEIAIKFVDPDCVKRLSFKLDNTDGTVFDLESIKDKPIFLDFSASWCQPCWESYPMITELFNQYKEKVEFITVLNDPEEDAVSTKDSEGLAWTVLYDEENDYAGRIGIKGIPTFIILDKEHNVVARYLGKADDSKEKIDKAIQDVLEK